MYSVYFYFDERGEVPVRNFIKELNKKSRSKIGRYIDLLEQQGPNLIRPYADQVRDKIRELRVRTTDGHIRIFYFFFIEKRIILLHAFRKKSQDLPEWEIEQAERNMYNFLDRYKQGNISL